MNDRLVIPAANVIKWEFQVQRQGFITRFGRAGGEYYKQTILQSGIATPSYPVRRTDKRTFTLARKLAL